MTTFQRARSEEQREARRRAILDAAADMLAEMPVAQVSLNELSRRAGLAKSNVLRYFDSREAVLLELLNSAWQEWLGQLEEILAGVDAGAPTAERGDQSGRRARRLARVKARAVRPVQRAGRSAGTQRLAAGRRGIQADGHGERGRAGPPDPRHAWVSSASTTASGWRARRSWWPARCGRRAQPSAAMLAAYQADPELAAMRLDFAATVREVLEVLIAGLLARLSR